MASSSSADINEWNLVDDLEKSESTSTTSDSRKDAICGLCSGEEATHWCEDCAQWLGNVCAKSHTKIPALRDHKLLSVSLKCDQIKQEFTREAKGIKDVVDKYSRSIQEIKERVARLGSTQYQALEKSKELRKKALQEINDIFNAIDAQIMDFVPAKIQHLQNKQEELSSKLNHLESHWKNLQSVMKQSENTIVTEGASIVTQVKKLKVNTGDVRVDMDDVIVTLLPGHQWRPESVAELKISGGNIRGKLATSLSSESAYDEEMSGSSWDNTRADFSHLLDTTLVLEKQSKFSKTPDALRLINNQLWVCQKNGTIDIFDLGLAKVSRIKNKTWGNVRDVASINEDILIIGASKGLYQISNDGQEIAKIDPGEHTSTVVFAGKLYTSTRSPGKLKTYSYRGGSWKVDGVFQLPHDGHYTVCATADSIFACRYGGDRIYRFSHIGDLLKLYATSKSEASVSLLNPLSCQVDVDGRLFVADQGNDRIQVIGKDGSRNVVHLNPQVKKPTGAVYSEGRLYVVTSDTNRLQEYV